MRKSHEAMSVLVALAITILLYEVEAAGHVNIQLQVLQYENPTGTSYHGQDFHSARKCCDITGSSNCTKPDADVCDTYFYFCIGQISHGRCSGAEYSTKNQLLHGLSYSKSSGKSLIQIMKMDSWQPSSIEILPDVFDIDRGSPDLIDNFTAPLTAISPDRDRLSAKAHLLTFHHFTSLAIELKVWCQDGFTGHYCEIPCTTDSFHTCDVTGKYKLPLPSCGDPSVITMKLPNVGSRSLSTLRSDLFQFIMENICPARTTGIDIKFLHVADTGPVEFRASCKNGSATTNDVIHNIAFQMHYFILYYTKKASLQHYFAAYNPVPGTLVTQLPTPTGPRMLLLSFEKFYNEEHSSDCKRTECTTKITICYSLSGSRCNGQVVYTAKQLRSSANITACNNYVKDPANPTTPTSKALYFIKLPSQILSLKVDVTVDHKNIWSSQKTVDYTVSPNMYNKAVPIPITFTSQTKMLQLEAMVWCALGTWGDKCQFHCRGHISTTTECGPSGSYTCKSGYHYNNGRCTDDDECHSRAGNPCHHGGQCSNTPGSFTCRCPEGWTGADCSVDVDECSLGVCTNCTNTPGGYTCYCQHGFTGNQCEDIDECSTGSHHCVNQGTCLNTYGGYTCLCKDGFTGENCQNDINECALKHCNGYHTSRCTNTAGGFNCTCNDGWLGKLCDADINECLHDPCKHGKCTNSPGSYHCLCNPGFTGNTCDHDIDECNSQAGHNTCKHNGVCINVPGSFYCNCTVGWEGNKCENDIDECSHGLISKYCSSRGTCKNAAGGYTCSCNRGFTGKTCDQDIDECQNSSSCIHGNCTNMPGGFTCSCESGWKGQHCREDINECLSNPCVHGKCVNTAPGYSCQCISGWRGKNCSDDINECSSPTSCKHGTCQNTNGSFQCKCEDGWQGSHCDQVKGTCSKDKDCIHGHCIIYAGSHTCSCPPEWQGDHCQNDVNECASNSSCVHGKCTNTHGGFSCFCDQGWKGSHCTDDNNECLHNPCFHGQCFNLKGSYKCSCLPGYTGRKCENDIDECSSHFGSSLCANNGTCINTPGSFSCNCSGGWTSSSHCHVDINECSTTNPCEHGTCKNTPGSYHCICADGWQGAHCNYVKGVCSMAKDCRQGKCIIASGNHKCLCVKGWVGLHCDRDIDECKNSSFCIHGKCTNTLGGFICSCENGWKGQRCSEDINECSNNPCVHGRCVNEAPSYSCRCDSGWHGRNCSEDSTNVTPDSHSIVASTSRTSSLTVLKDTSTRATNVQLKNTLASTTEFESTSATTAVTTESTKNISDSSAGPISTSPANPVLHSTSTRNTTPTAQGNGHVTSAAATSPRISRVVTLTTDGHTPQDGIDQREVYMLEFKATIDAKHLASIKHSLQEVMSEICSSGGDVDIKLHTAGQKLSNSVQFTATCAGQIVSNDELSEAFSTMSPVRLESLFPQELKDQEQASSKTWIHRHATATVVSVAVLAVLAFTLLAYARHRRYKQVKPKSGKVRFNDTEEAGGTLELTEMYM